MRHICHWPGCQQEIPPQLFMCRGHWFALPKLMRKQIWATYRSGQEINKNPSAEYIAAARAAQEWALDRERTRA